MSSTNSPITNAVGSTSSTDLATSEKNAPTTRHRRGSAERPAQPFVCKRCHAQQDEPSTPDERTFLFNDPVETGEAEQRGPAAAEATPEPEFLLLEEELLEDEVVAPFDMPCFIFLVLTVVLLSLLSEATAPLRISYYLKSFSNFFGMTEAFHMILWSAEWILRQEEMSFWPVVAFLVGNVLLLRFM